MGCCGAREKPDKILETQKWDYINLSDFRSSSCIPPFSYGILFISFMVSIASYVIDVFTASQLMIFDRWSGRIEPVVPLSISRWIFLGCIMASWVFLVYRFWKARRAILSGGIAQSYLDPLAVRLQSARVGNGRGWRRFLVFAEMTKGKKGADYVALFTFFSFEAWYRIIFAEGPRNVINGMTIYSVVKSNLIPDGQNQGMSPIMQFFTKVKILADGDHIRLAVLVGMIFVVLTWIFAFISLALSCFFYVFFLWHHIPAGESLRKYCKRKVDGRLSKIVDVKVTKALKKAEERERKQQLAASRTGDGFAGIKRQPTLPVLEGGMPVFERSKPAAVTTMADPEDARQPTLPVLDPYSQPAEFDDRQPTLPTLDAPLRPFAKRSGTSSSAKSYGSNAPLMGDASPMGQAAPRSYSPALAPASAPPMPFPQGMQGPQRSFSPAPSRALTPGAAVGSAQSRPPLSRADTTSTNRALAGQPPLSRMDTNMSSSTNRMMSPAESYGRNTPGPQAPLGRTDTTLSSNAHRMMTPTDSANGRFTPGPPQRVNTGASSMSSTSRGPPRMNPGFGAYNPTAGRSSPAPSQRPTMNTPAQEFEMRPQTPTGFPNRAYSQASSHAQPPPQRSFTAPAYQPQQYQPQPPVLPSSRNFSSPTNQLPPRPRDDYDDSIYDAY